MGRFLRYSLLLLFAGLVSSSRAADAVFPEDHPLIKAFGGKRLDLWSFKPVQAAAPPAPAEASWAANPIDAFVSRLYEKRGLQPLPPVDRAALCRRLHFDLTGLPPRPQDVEAFVADAAPDALERLADRLLASEASAVHLAGWWLDLVRYSDSNGYDWDEFRPQAWRYRDYVVRSFRYDKPFDRFVREQLAGDEMVATEPANADEQDALIATGFLRVGPWDNSSKLFGEEYRTRTQWMSDLVETTGTAFLGLTFACCRCHDHKYDPLTQADYYRLRAFFEPLEFKDGQPVDLASDQALIRAQHAEADAKAKPHREAVDALREAVRERLRKDGKRKADDKISDEEADKAMSDDESSNCKEHLGKAKKLESQKRPFTTALMAADGKTRETRLLSAGNPDDPRQEVAPGIPCFFDPGARAPAAVSQGLGRRTALADWIVSRDNPLTARVLANRLWHLMFGDGLVPTVDDFGLAGGAPAAPELLDWLAAELPRQGWSIRRMLRLIATSAAYRQKATAETDAPGMRKLRRLNAEQLRDAMLFVSGKMAGECGGPPVWPELPADVLQANPAFLDDNAEKTKAWYPSPPERQGVRSVFLVRKRSVKVPFLETFDLPENFQSCGSRRVSTVAPQALVLMNSDFASEAARALAERVGREAGEDTDARMRRAWSLALGRAPSDDELGVIRQVWQSHGAAAGCRVIFNLNEFVYVD